MGASIPERKCCPGSHRQFLATWREEFIFLNPQCPSHFAPRFPLMDPEAQSRLVWPGESRICTSRVHTCMLGPISAPQDPRPDLWLLPGPFSKLTGLGPTGTVGRRAPNSAAPGRAERGGGYRGSRAPPPATHLLFSQAWPRDFRPPPKRGGLPCLLRPQGPGSPQSVSTWGRESLGGHPAVRPTSFQPEPGSESWKNRIRQWRPSPQTDPKQPRLCQANQQTLQHKHWAPGSGSGRRRGHFSEVTSALKVLCFLPAQPREQSPQSP